MMRLLRRLRYLLQRDRHERELDDELRFHLDMKRQELESGGLDQTAAALAARRALGNLPLTRDQVRDVWMAPWLQGAIQDYKLGLRMLLKYPGLTLAGGLALAIAICIGAGWYDLSGKLLAPTIPLPDGDRLVLIETRNILTNEPERRVARDFLEWRREIRMIEDLGAYRTDTRNLVAGNGPPESIRLAELTAAAFGTARVPPLLGRGLLDADERPGAPGVVVLGYYVWQRFLGGRDDVVGSGVTLGEKPATVIGVMPEGFRYPVNHEAWSPLSLRASYEALEGGCDQRHRQAGSRRHAAAGERRAARARGTGGRSAPGVARAPPAARDATRRNARCCGRSTCCSEHRAVLAAERARAAGARHCVHERRHPGLREDGDTGGRDHPAFRARCKPRARDRSTLRRGTRAGVGRGCARPPGG